jgi:hypothetical protein
VLIGMADRRNRNLFGDIAAVGTEINSLVYFVQIYGMVNNMEEEAAPFIRNS